MYHFAANSDFLAICKYLRSLTKAEITELGVQLGLSFQWLKNHKSSEIYCYDMVDAWLKKQDSVAEMCLPSWQNLVATLREVDQNVIADQVTNERGTHKAILVGNLLHTCRLRIMLVRNCMEVIKRKF